MLSTPKLLSTSVLGFFLLATIGCTSNANQASVQPNSEATTPTASPESEVVQTQPTPSPEAAEPVQATSPQPSPVASAPPQSSEPEVLVRDFCAQKGQKVEQYFETNNFRIYLCYDNSNQIFYYGVDKRNQATIALPAYTEEGTGYVAENGNYDYIVTGASLSVYESSKLILEETVIRSL
ncbi:hypothetical protein IQ249_13545 [Lusitaniella coriacea LEGE 07157]|uniref:Uncharacterized protein n=1 Tax=Lusitaniella coriacea LEGE 07157 TaxID=945747 RepID=A0A8J7DXA4_9CYAN|nr:hypothetical protein [Lusitaniella coriacea]MBE9116926.1 hypothetical protein [Lusitaniella coriacea LEGE 07157]